MPSKKQKQEQLAKEWKELQERHAQHQKFSSRNQNHRQPKIKDDSRLDLGKVLGQSPRQVTNAGVRISSVPMRGSATVPHDPSLEAAKMELRGRTGQLFNKGGMQFMTDQDLADLKRGTNRKHV